MSTMIQTQTKQDKKLIDGQYSKDVKISSKQQSRAQITDYERLRTEQKEGVYFVQISYDSSPSIDRFVKRLKKRYPTIPNDTSTPNTYLQHTPINEIIVEQMNRPIAFRLIRKDNQWYIGYKKVLQRLDSRDFMRFFATVKNPAVQIDSSNGKKELKDKERFFFYITADKKGFVSLLTVYEDGTVAVLMENIPIQKSVKTAIPDEDFEQIFEAGLLHKDQETFDLYVVVFSQKELTLDRFASADDQVIDNEKYRTLMSL